MSSSVTLFTYEILLKFSNLSYKQALNNVIRVQYYCHSVKYCSIFYNLSNLSEMSDFIFDIYNRLFTVDIYKRLFVIDIQNILGNFLKIS